MVSPLCFPLYLETCRVLTRHVSQCDTCFVAVYLSFFETIPRGQSSVTRFLLIRHIRPDVTSLKLREVLIADGKCDLTPEEFCLLVVIHSRYRVVTSLLCNRFESHTSRSMFEDIFIYMVGIKLVEIFFFSNSKCSLLKKKWFFFHKTNSLIR